MAQSESAHIQGKHISVPLIDEYAGSDFVDEPISPDAPAAPHPVADWSDEKYASIQNIAEPISTGAWRPVVSAAQTTGQERYENYSRGSAAYGKKKRRISGTQIALATVAALLIGVLAYAGFQFFKDSYKESVNEQLRPSDVEDAQAAKEVLTPTTSRDPFYMMIIGSDTRNDDEGERSDTNIVARVDPQEGVISMISIPRDTAIMLEGRGTQKFNAAFAYDGIPGAITAAEGLLGIKISHYAVLDFDGMISLVDALGGVTVDVPVRISDPDAGPVEIEAGEQELDGEAALVFARSRAYATGDFQRTTNQRLLINAMLNKAMELSTTDLPRVIEGAAECLTTDMSVNMIEDYALYFMNFEELTVYSVMVPSTTAMNQGSSYVVCDTAALQQVMDAIDRNEDPSQYVADYTVYSSAEAQEAGMPDAIGIDSRLIEGDGTVYEETYDTGYGYGYGYYY